MSVTPRVIRPGVLDWVKFDIELARDGSVDPVEKALYAALASFVDADDRGSNPDPDPDPDDENVPTRTRLAECIGRSVDTVDRVTRRLEERGLVRVTRRRDPDNPKRNLPSLYELCDHEWWDERAAARAEARRKAREARGGRTDAARGSRTDAARGSRTDAARGSRTDAAVPLPPENVSLSEAREAREPGENPAPEAPAVTADVKERERQQQAQTVAQAWTAGTGMPRVPDSEKKIARQALELLREGHEAAHLASVARWMSRQGWRDLGYALTAKGAPKPLEALPGTSPSPFGSDSCGECDPDRLVETEDGRVTYCPRCHPKSTDTVRELEGARL